MFPLRCARYRWSGNLLSLEEGPEPPIHHGPARLGPDTRAIARIFETLHTRRFNRPMVDDIPTSDPLRISPSLIVWRSNGSQDVLHKQRVLVVDLPRGTGCGIRNVFTGLPLL